MLYILVFLLLCGILVILHPEGSTGETEYTLKMLRPPALLFGLLVFLVIGDYTEGGFTLKLSAGLLAVVLHYAFNAVRLAWLIWRAVELGSVQYWKVYLLFTFLLAILLLFTLGAVLDTPDQIVSGNETVGLIQPNVPND